MNVRNITSCPTKLDVFRSRGRNLGCSVGNEYHCMLDEKKHHVELCISRSWIQPDHCPEYNTAANRIDVTSCDASEGVCPPTIYWSNTSFQYNGCLGNSGTANTNDPEEESIDVLVPVVISVVIVLLLVIVSVALLCYVKRRRRIKKGDDEKDRSLKVLSVPVSLEQSENGRKVIEEHRNDCTYVPTNAARNGKKIFNEKKILIIKGVTGSGKTKTALQIASEWMREDEPNRTCVYLSSFDDHHVPNILENTCIIFDNCFTRWALDSSSSFIPTFCLHIYEKIKYHKNMYLIITIQTIIYTSHRQMLQKLALFTKENELSLSYENFEERKEILKSHFNKLSNKFEIPSATDPNTNDKKLGKLLSNCTKEVGFPSTCWMYTNIPECRKEKSAFFRACHYILQNIIEKSKNPLRCCLYYGMLRTYVDYLDTTALDQECLKELREVCGYKTITVDQIHECFEKEDKYFSRGKTSGIYSFSQTLIYEECLKIWMQWRYIFLRLCSVQHVKENIRDETYTVESRDSIFRLKISEYENFAPKFVSLLKDYKELENHPLLQNKVFLEHLEKARAKQETNPQMEEQLPHKNETDVQKKTIPNQNTSDGDKNNEYGDACFRNSESMEAFPQQISGGMEQAPLLNMELN